MATLITIPTDAIRDFESFSSRPGVSSRMSMPFVFNEDTTTAQNAPTNPYAIAAGSHADDALVRAFRIPAGATYLFLAHEYVGSAPTTLPIVRAYGRMPLEKKFPSATLPESVDASYHAPSMGDYPAGRFVPLGNLATAQYAFTLPATIAQLNGSASVLCEAVVLHVAGATHVLVPVVQAAVGPTRGLVFGWCEG